MGCQFREWRDNMRKPPRGRCRWKRCCPEVRGWEFHRSANGAKTYQPGVKPRKTDDAGFAGLARGFDLCGVVKGRIVHTIHAVHTVHHTPNEELPPAMVLLSPPSMPSDRTQECAGL